MSIEQILDTWDWSFLDDLPRDVKCPKCNNNKIIIPICEPNLKIVWICNNCGNKIE